MSPLVHFSASLMFTSSLESGYLLPLGAPECSSCSLLFSARTSHPYSSVAVKPLMPLNIFFMLWPKM